MRRVSELQHTPSAGASDVQRAVDKNYMHQRTRNPFKIARALWRMIRNLEDTRSVLILEDVFSRAAPFRKLAAWDRVAKRVIPAELRARPLAEWPRMPNMDLNRMRAECPRGSLGYVIATHMMALGLTPDLFHPAKVRCEADYVIVHLTEAHDIWHVVSGFGNDEPGEFGAVGFSLAQTGAPVFVGILAIGLLNTLIFEPHRVVERMEGLSRGWLAGRAARNLFGIDWLQHWHRPIDALRRELCLPLQVDVGQGILSTDGRGSTK
jgi:ubiquinone biosynthesis protein Coq4